MTMGSFDGAETCELVESYLLSQLLHIITNIGLYHHDTLDITKTTPKETENIKKEMGKFFFA